jgi:hypothetical protein
MIGEFWIGLAAILAVKVAKVAKVANVFRIPPSRHSASLFCPKYWTDIDLCQNHAMFKQALSRRVVWQDMKSSPRAVPGIEAVM